MRLAFFSPFQPQKSGISDYSEELLPHLARYAELDLFYAGDRPTNPELARLFALYPIDQFPVQRAQRGYTTCLYQISNNPLYHMAIYNMLRHYPGITVLHEHILHGLFFSLSWAEEKQAAYWRELLYHTTDLAVLKNLPTDTKVSNPLTWPLAKRVVDLSLGVIGHNHELARRVLATNPGARLEVTPMGMPLPAIAADYEEQMAIRRRLNLPTQAHIIGSFGFFSTNRRLDVALRAFARLHQQQPETLYLMVGEDYGYHTRLLAKIGLNPQAVVITGYVEADKLGDYIQAADVCINLRYPVYGETSSMALRLMAYGKPLIISDVETLADFPADTCLRIGVNAAEEELLYRYLLLLVQQPHLRLQLGRNARQYIQTEHSPERAAATMIAAIQRILTAVGQGTSYVSDSGCPLERDIDTPFARQQQLIRRLESEINANSAAVQRQIAISTKQLVAKEQVIQEQHRQLLEKEEMIQEQHRQLLAKEKVVEQLRRQVWWLWLAQRFKQWLRR